MAIFFFSRKPVNCMEFIKCCVRLFSYLGDLILRDWRKLGVTALENRPGTYLKCSGMEWCFWDAPRCELRKCNNPLEWKLFAPHCASQPFHTADAVCRNWGGFCFNRETVNVDDGKWKQVIKWWRSEPLSPSSPLPKVVPAVLHYLPGYFTSAQKHGWWKQHQCGATSDQRSS